MSGHRFFLIILLFWAGLIVGSRVQAPVPNDNFSRPGDIPDTLRSMVLDTLPMFDSCHRARPMCLNSTYSYVTPLVTSWAYIWWYECCVGDTQPECCVAFGCISQFSGSIVHFRPHWFYIKIATPGALIYKAYTVPFVSVGMLIYGPFSDPTSACVEGLTSDKIVDCWNPFQAYPGDTATCTIPNALPNEYYLIRISGIDHDVFQYQVNFYQSNYGQPGAGSTTCDFVTHCSILEITHQESACNPLSNTFSVSGQIYFSNPPSTGYLVVWDSLTGYASTIPPPFQSPMSFTIAGLPCDNLLHPIYASFWDSVGCENHINVQAPVLCPDATISGGGGICDDGVSTAQIQISFTPNAAPPYTFAWRVNGVAQPSVTSSGPFPFLFTTQVAGIYTMDTSYNSFCTGTLNGQAVVSLLPLPQPNLGTDITTCEGRVVILDPGTGFMNYLWSTGDTGPTLEVYKAGTYWVQVQASNGCINSDTISVNFVPQPGAKFIKHQ
ncbi:MAG: hypothetical protein ACP5O2_11565 [Bacteroidales bacterium]